MKIAEVINELESFADRSLQESYDNAGLLTGSPDWDCTGIICTLDATEEVIREAISRKANLVVAHHPVIFRGLKKLTGKTYVERTIIIAVRNDIAIYAVHTNLDNVKNGVSGHMARLLGLRDVSVLDPKKGLLKKIVTFVPTDKAEQVRNAIFNAGGGHIGNYSECSYNSEGYGTFNAGTGTDPYVGEAGIRHREEETRVEIVFPVFLELPVVLALRKSHPYEEPAFDIYDLSNEFQQAGAGSIGTLPAPLPAGEFLQLVKNCFQTEVVRHTRLQATEILRVAICGGAGSFLIPKALAARADAFITADMKYHEFFDADGHLLIADPGHYESEQFTIDLLQQILAEKFPTFAVLKTRVKTNPVHYYK